MKCAETVEDDDPSEVVTSETTTGEPTLQSSLTCVTLDKEATLHLGWHECGGRSILRSSLFNYCIDAFPQGHFGISSDSNEPL